jgi:hypothetical protein
MAPSFAQAWGVRGLSRYHMGDNEGAIEDLERFLELAEPGQSNPSRASAESALAEARSRLSGSR